MRGVVHWTKLHSLEDIHQYIFEEIISKTDNSEETKTR